MKTESSPMPNANCSSPGTSVAGGCHAKFSYNINDGTADISEPLLPYTPFIIENGILCLHDAEGFKVIKADTQETLWKTPIDKIINKHPLLTNNLIIISTQMGNSYALREDMGDVLWRSDAQAISNVAADSSRLYFLSGKGYLAVVDKNNGQEIQKLEFLPISFDMFTSERIVGGYNVWIDSQDSIVVVSFGDSCQLMAFKLNPS